MRILYVPLDERPCNYHFPGFIAEGTDYELVEPPLSILGHKKEPAKIEELWNWVYENIQGVEGAILSIDMLLYGGIVPSRLHSFSAEFCIERLEGLRKIKELNSEIKIYVFNLIMRCPRYSSNDEEPDYYEQYGLEIFKTGFIHHKIELGAASEEEIKEVKSIQKRLPVKILDDYVHRRKVNRRVNRAVLDYVKDGTVDFMVIPQDDAAPYGYTATDQSHVREYITKNKLGLKAYMYPGADEVGCTLLARMVNEHTGKKPRVYPRFSSEQAPFIIPLYEDRSLIESVKYQILCAGGLVCYSEREADVILMVNAPGKNMMEASMQKQKGMGYTVERNLAEFVEYIEYIIHTAKKGCIIADVAFANGSDLELITLLKEKGLLFKVAGYAGWNTSSNSLGTCIAQGMFYHIYGARRKHVDFLALRYVEDAGYCAAIRNKVSDEKLQVLGFNYFKVDGQRGEVSKIIKEDLEIFIKENLQDENYHILIRDCYMPWDRMFEVGLQVEAIPVGVEKSLDNTI